MQKSFNYKALGRGDAFIKNGEFIITDHDSLFKAAAEFIAAHGGKPHEVDTGFMGIKGPILLDDRQSEIDHKRCGYPRIVKFKLESLQEGDIAKVLYSFDYLDTINLTAVFQQNGFT